MKWRKYDKVITSYCAIQNDVENNNGRFKLNNGFTHGEVNEYIVHKYHVCIDFVNDKLHMPICPKMI
jgi:hypothetical protein